MSKLYVQSPQGAINSICVKIDSYYIQGTSGSSWTQWAILPTGFAIGRGDFQAAN